MKKVDQYMLKELAVPFLIGTVSVQLMFLANQYIYLFKTFSLQNVPFSAFSQLVLYKAPYWANFTFPMGMTLAASMAVSRVTRESELTAMRAAGARILRVLRPIAVFGLIVAVGNFLSAEMVMPPAEKRFNKLSREVAVLGGIPNFIQNQGLKLKNWWVYFGGIQRAPDGKLVLTDIVVFERPQLKMTEIKTAKNGTYSNGNWELTDVFVWVLDGQDLVVAKADEPMMITEPIDVDSLFGGLAPEEKTLEELRQTIETNRNNGLNTIHEEMQYHHRFALPAACLVFAIVSPVFAVWFAKSGAFMGVFLSMIVVLLYYNAWVISTEILGKNGWTAPWLAAWLPNIIFIIFGLFAIRRLE